MKTTQLNHKEKDVTAETVSSSLCDWKSLQLLPDATVSSCLKLVISNCLRFVEKHSEYFELDENLENYFDISWEKH